MMEIKKIDHNFSVCQVEDYSLVNLLMCDKEVIEV